MTNTQSLHRTANATLLIRSANGSGSGFIFRRPDIAVTNFHVVADSAGLGAITVRNMLGQECAAQIIVSSPKEQYDFAILRLEKTQPGELVPLDADPSYEAVWGDEVAFAGYPFGLTPLLVGRGSVSGSQGISIFLTASINPGNSGGPVSLSESGRVIGIATARRLILSEQIQQLASEQDKLIAQLDVVSGQGSVNIMGIDFVYFAKMLANSLKAVKEAMVTNANPGIGISNHIKFVVESYDKIPL